MNLYRSRFRGCLLAGAVGDALGAAVEFMSRDAILARYGTEGIRELDPAYGRIGAITDDTQMTLFTAEGLLRGQIRATARGICDRTGVIARAYQRWLLTQGQQPLPEDRPVPVDGWLYALPALHARRAPGNTCLKALAGTPRGRPASNQSKGCGGVMRVAPIGLFAWHFDRGRSVRHAFELANQAAALTHGHPTGHLTAGVMAAVVQLLVEGQPLPQAIETSCDLLVEQAGHEETLQAIRAAGHLARTDPDADIAELGQGWIAEEALAMSLFVALVSTDMEDALRRAVNHSGDSDSTGAITGNLLGAAWGDACIPPRWLDVLELRAEIQAVADDLFDCKDWDFGADAAPEHACRPVWERYPGH